MVNFTCPAEKELPQDPVPFFQNGNLNFKAHDVGWLVCGVLTLIASSTSFWLVWKHLTYYTCPLQQRHIIRMLFMVPIYAIVSTLSYLFYHQALYYQVIRDCYEAVVITSFFYLFLQYLGDTRAEQYAVFKDLKVDKWMWPLGFIKKVPQGLSFLWVMKICILQYAIVRPVCTIMTVTMQYFNVYCLASWMPWFGHIWMSAAISISVSVAMYCILQFYWPLKKELAPYKPVLKFLAIKSTVFLTFWQDTFLSLLVSFKVIKPTEYWTAEHIQVGLNAIMCTAEMVIFAFLHVKAFTYVVYRPKDKSRTTTRWRAFFHMLDYRDWFFEMKDTTSYYVAKAKGRDFSYVEEVRAKKYEHLQAALGKSRDEELKIQLERERDTLPTFWKKGKGGGDDDEDYDDGAFSETHDGTSTDVDLEKGGRGKSSKKSSQGDRSSKKSGPKSSDKTSTAAKDSPLTKLRELEKDVDEEAGLLEYAARVQREDRTAQHPELTLFHRPPVFDGELGPADKPDPELEDDYRAHYMWTETYDRTGHYLRPSEQDEADKGAGHKKEGSWWRSFRERISGSWGGSATHQHDDGADAQGTKDVGEKEAMIKEEEEEEDQTGFTDQRKRGVKTVSSEPPSTFAVAESPLAMIIGGTINGEKPRSAELAPQFLPMAATPSQVQQQDANFAAARFAPVITTTPYAAEPQPLVAAASTAQPELVSRSNSMAISSQHASLSAYTSQEGHRSSVGGHVPTATAAPLSSMGPPPASTAAPSPGLRWAEQTKPSDARKAPQAPSTTGSIGAPASLSRSATALGPKGKKINLVMPGALSSSPAEPASAPSASSPAGVPIVQAPTSFRMDDQPRSVPHASSSCSSQQSSIEQWRSQAAVVPPSMPIDYRASKSGRPRSDSQPSQGSRHPETSGRSRRDSQPHRSAPRPRSSERDGRVQSTSRQSAEFSMTQRQLDEANRRSRRISAPAAPVEPIATATINPDTTFAPDQQKRKGKDKYSARSNIPAPSQLAAMTDGEDPFAAGAHALDAKATPEQEAGASTLNVVSPPRKVGGPKHPHLSSVQAEGGSAFAVGSIVTPDALAQAAPSAAQLAQRAMFSPNHGPPRGYGPPPVHMPVQPRHQPMPIPQSRYQPPAMPVPQQHFAGSQHYGSRQYQPSYEPAGQSAIRQQRPSQTRPSSRHRQSMPPGSGPYGFGKIEYID